MAYKPLIDGVQQLKEKTTSLTNAVDVGDGPRGAKRADAKSCVKT